MTSLRTAQEDDTGARGGLAFALTGLGGSNAFGAGFLQAALDQEVEPRIITCTSGMIYWTWRYLEALRVPEEKRTGRLRREVEASIAEAQPFPQSVDALNEALLMTVGVPGVFRWAQPEYFARFLTAPLMSLSVPLDEALENLFLPSQWLVPLRPKADFENMAKAFNLSPIGVCFNSFEAESGVEYLHVNGPAREMLAHEDERMEKANVAKPSKRAESAGRAPWRSLPGKAEVDIDELGVEDALWLTLYGPHSNVGRGAPANRIDGAYLRSVILSELTMVDAVIIPRPVRSQRPAFPLNWFEVQDFQTELWWNASFAPQAASIDFVNRLVDNDLLRSGGFRRVDLVPVEIDVDRGFFLYFREDLETFDRGYNEAVAAFERLRLPRTEIGKAVTRRPRALAAPASRSE